MNTMDLNNQQVMIITNMGDLRDMLLSLLQGGVPMPATPTGKATLVPTNVARKVLMDKGYPVKSTQAFNRMMEIFAIVPVQKGRNNWYDAEQINNIPNNK